MKNEAFNAGVQEAEGYVRQVVAITEKAYHITGERFATGHFSSPSARRNFFAGWMSKAPTFVDGERVSLTIRIMNYGDTNAIEKQMYELFSPYGSCVLSFLSASSICLSYAMEIDSTVLNWTSQSAFLHGKQVRYRLKG